MVKTMVVALAVGEVSHDVEVGGWEGGAAGLTDETFAVVAAGESTVCAGDGFAKDGLVAAAAGALGGGGAFVRGGRGGFGA